MEPLFKVPIRNLFCLLSYVNEMPELIESFNDVDEDLITYDFLAKQFLQEVNSLKSRGLLKSYVTNKEATNRLGGRLVMNGSIAYIVSKRPMMVCEKDEYSPNVLLNQVMKATLKALSVNRYVKKETRISSFMELEMLAEVEGISLTKETFSRIHFTRHTVAYKRMVHIARLLHELLLLSHKQGNWSLFSAVLDEKALNHLFEKFLFHFYHREQQEYKVASEVMKWQLDGNQAFLPTMKTDISLTHKRQKQKIIIDAKFYKNMFQENYGKASFHSHNMYQLFTYLMHQPKDLNVRGILIYPFNGKNVDESYLYDERMTMEVMTINLDASWKDIHKKLLGIIT